MTEEVFKRLIPELSTFFDDREIDIDLWRDNVGRYGHAVAYARLFWPDFIIHDDCVFTLPFGDESDVENYLNWMESLKGDKSSVEVMLNHVHIADLFDCDPEPPSNEMIVYLGRLLKSMWSAKLAVDFPDRNMVVSFPEEGEGPRMNDEITFWTERSGQRHCR